MFIGARVAWRSVAVILIVASSAAAQPTAYPPIGVGARVFVTKCHPARGNLSPADFQQLADAGFTVAVNKWQTDLAQYSSRAAAAGLSVMRWEMGLVDAVDDIDRTTTRAGKTTRYTTPQSPRAWQVLTGRIVEVARLSLEHPNLQGVLLDFEIYDRAKTDGFCESYDDQTFREFFAGIGRDAPNPLPPAIERNKWLLQHSMLGLYIGLQIDQVARQVAQLRRAVDAVNPRFQIGVYGWGALVPPVIHEVATPAAPGLVLDAMTYGRSIYSNAFEGGYDADRPDREGLKWSLLTVGQRRGAENARYPNTVFLAGHYPQAVGPADGTQYKFTARQAFNSAAFGNGYWIWTDWVTPKPFKDRQEWINAMMDYFRQAHAALDAGDYMWAAREPEAIASPKATQPRVVITSDGQQVRFWHPRRGQTLSGPAAAPATVDAQTTLQHGPWQFRIVGEAVEAVSADGVVVKRYPAGHGVCALAVGDVDGLPGEELLTLGAGQVKVWDVEAQIMVGRFTVGAGQNRLGVGEPVNDGK